MRIRLTWGWITVAVVAVLVTCVALDGFPKLKHREPRTERYASVEEAEEAAGFHIPRPGPEYSVESTTLEWWGHDDRPVSYTSYHGPGLESRFISVTVALREEYPDDPGYRAMLAQLGMSTTIGARTGWLTGWNDPARASRRFTFECGSLDGAALWCEVSAAKDIGRDVFEAFIATLE